MATLSYTAGSAVFEGRRNYQEDRVLVLPDFAKSSATPAQLRRVRRALPPGRCGGVDVLRMDYRIDCNTTTHSVWRGVAVVLIGQ